MTIIKCTEIPYLNEDIIEKYKNVIVVSTEGMIIKMNLLILCAMSDSLRMAFLEDNDNHTIITEFSLEELKQVKDFCIRGSCNALSKSILDSFGLKMKLTLENSTNHDQEEAISENSYISNSYPSLENNSLIKTEIVVKNEIVDIKDEPLMEDEEMDFSLGYFSDDFDPSLIVEKTTRKKNVIVKRKVSENNEDYCDTTTMKLSKIDTTKGQMKTTKEVTKKSRKGRRRISDRKFSDTELELFKSFEMPKPLEEYKTKPRNLRNLRNGKEEILNETIKSFQCTQCQLRLVNKPLLRNHEIKHHKEHLPCSFCNDAFEIENAEEFKKHLFFHIILRNKSGKFKGCCVQCGYPGSKQISVAEHMKRKGPFHNDECCHCFQKMPSFQAYQDHIKNQHYGVWKFKCGKCSDQAFIHKKDFNSHIRVFHSTKSVEQKKVKTNNEHKSSTITTMTICSICGMKPKNISTHMRSNHGEPIPCQHCGKTCAGPQKLYHHIRMVHQKTFCPKCGEMVTGSKDNHMKRHIPPDERPHKCKTCGKGFFDRNKLEEHHNVHTGEKPFKCKYCPAAFASQGTRACHQRGHLGIKRK